MEITFINQINDEEFNQFEQDLSSLLHKTLSITKFNDNVTLSVVLVDDETIQNYNKEFRNLDQVTDVLSFVDGETLDGEISLGDIIISNETCKRQAEDYGHSLKREFLFLVVHGYLHLLGYDHINKDDEVEMFNLQKEILDAFVSRNST